MIIILPHDEFLLLESALSPVNRFTEPTHPGVIWLDMSFTLGFQELTKEIN